MTRFKVCGLRRAEDAQAAIGEGAGFIGLIFAPSKRQVTAEQGRQILAAARERDPDVAAVGVFVNAPADEVNRTAETCKLARIQLHGDETLEYCNSIERPVLKVVRIEAGERDDALLARLALELESIVAAGHTPMLDTVSTGPYYGGTGRPFDWGLAAELSGKFDFVLSGGLSPENVGEAIRRVRPWTVDVSSGVETDGVKDPDKIRAFAQAVSRADSAAEDDCM